MTLVFFAILFGVPRVDADPGPQARRRRLRAAHPRAAVHHRRAHLPPAQRPGQLDRVGADRRRAADLHPVRAARAAASGSRDRPARARQADDVAGAAHRGPVRHQRARRADPARRPSPRADPRSVGYGLEPRLGRHLVSDRRLPDLADRRRAAVPAAVEAGDAAHRPDRRRVLRGRGGYLLFIPLARPGLAGGASTW